MDVLLDEVKSFHEAAHAVVHFHFGHELEEVSSAGYCKLADWECEVDRSDVADLIENEIRLQKLIAYCAGEATHAHFFGRNWENASWRRSHDYRQALKHALALSGQDLEAAELLVKWGQRIASVLVAGLWDDIHKVAFKLLEVDKLNHDEVNTILEEGRRARNREPARA